MFVLKCSNDNALALVQVIAGRQMGLKAYIWSNTDSDLWHHVELLSHNELTRCGMGDFNEILDQYFSSQLQWLVAEISAVKLPSEECH